MRGVQEVTRGLSTCVPPFTKQSREGRGEGREGCVLLLCVVISGAQLPVGPHCKVPDNDLLHVSKSLVSSQVPVGATVSFICLRAWALGCLQLLLLTWPQAEFNVLRDPGTLKYLICEFIG